MTPLVAFIVVILVAVMVGNLIRRARAGVRSVRSHNRALDTLGHISTQRSNPGAGLASAPASTHQAHVRIVSPDPPPPPPVEPVVVEEPARVPVPSRLVLPPPPTNDFWDTATTAVPLVVPEANGHLPALAVNGSQVDTATNGLQAASGGGDVDVLAPEGPRRPNSGGPGDDASGGDGADGDGGANGDAVVGRDDSGKRPPRRRRPFDIGHRRKRDGRPSNGDRPRHRDDRGGGEQAGDDSPVDLRQAIDLRQPYDLAQAAEATASTRSGPDAGTVAPPAPDAETAASASFYPAASEGLAPRTFLGRLQPPAGHAQPGGVQPTAARTWRPGRADLVTLSPFSRQRQHRRTVLHRVAAIALLALVAIGVVATLDRHHSTPAVAAPVHHVVRPTTPTTLERAPARHKRTPAVRPVKLISDTNGTSQYQVPSRARITFKALGPCWVEVRQDNVGGRVLATRTLADGATESVTAPAWIRLGSPSAVSILVGGHQVNDPVPAGAPHDLQFG